MKRWAVLAQVAGVLMVLGAIAALAGPMWALGIGGGVLIAGGVLTEAGWL